MPAHRIPLADRFWPKVDRRGPDECWPWLAASLSAGYGLIGSGGQGRPRLAHRVAWELTNGPIPEGLFVCHRCDNPPCVNPAHLFLGTAKDNNRDSTAKGRHPRGESHHKTRLTVEQVAHVRRLRARGLSCSDIAFLYSMTQTGVSMISRGKTWGWLKEASA